MAKGYLHVQQLDTGHLIRILSTYFPLAHGRLSLALNNMSITGRPVSLSPTGPFRHDPCLGEWRFGHTGLMPLPDLLRLLEQEHGLAPLDAASFAAEVEAIQPPRADPVAPHAMLPDHTPA